MMNNFKKILYIPVIKNRALFILDYSDVREHFIDHHEAFNAKLVIQSIVIALLHDNHSSSQRVGLLKYAQET